jgi:hypothetical protein
MTGAATWLQTASYGLRAIGGIYDEGPTRMSVCRRIQRRALLTETGIEFPHEPVWISAGSAIYPEIPLDLSRLEERFRARSSWVTRPTLNRSSLGRVAVAPPKSLGFPWARAPK